MWLTFYVTLVAPIVVAAMPMLIILMALPTVSRVVGLEGPQHRTLKLNLMKMLSLFRTICHTIFRKKLLNSLNLQG